MADEANVAAENPSVWDEIKDTWGKLHEKTAAPGKPKKQADKTASADKLGVLQGSKLAKDIQKAGGFTKEILEKVHQRYDFCTGVPAEELQDMGTLQTFRIKQAMENPGAADAAADPGGEDPEAGFQGGAFGAWENFSPGSKKTWPQNKHNVVFGPRLIRPVMALFVSGKWFHDGTNKPIEGVTKYQHIGAPEDWV